MTAKKIREKVCKTYENVQIYINDFNGIFWYDY